MTNQPSTSAPARQVTGTSSLGAKLAARRKARGLTLQALSCQAGLSKSYLWELENRASQRPSAEKLQALADALGVAVTYFLEEDVRDLETRHVDDAFYRAYLQLEAPAKQQMRLILQTFKATP